MFLQRKLPEMRSQKSRASNKIEGEKELKGKENEK